MRVCQAVAYVHFKVHFLENKLLVKASVSFKLNNSDRYLLHFQFVIIIEPILVRYIIVIEILDVRNQLSLQADHAHFDLHKLLMLVINILGD